MNKNEFDDILESAAFYQIKEMLFCMDGLSFSDKKLVRIINTNRGLNKYYQEVLSRYSNFKDRKN